MYCPNCGKQNNENSKYCENCGTLLNPNNQMVQNPIPNNVPIQNNNINNSSNNNSNSKGKTSLILGVLAFVLSTFMNTLIGIPLSIVGIAIGFDAKKENKKIPAGLILNIIVLILSVITLFVGAFSFYKALVKDDNKAPVADTNNEKENNSKEDVNEQKVAGQYTNNPFSGNQFDYSAGYDKAVFSFNEDGTFNINYASGYVYKGTYELYNGIFIYTKTEEIRKDTSISDNVLIADSIDYSADKMVDASGSFTNVYLLWLRVNDNLIQPFVVLYNPNDNTGTTVNILARVQGKIQLKNDNLKGSN